MFYIMYSVYVELTNINNCMNKYEKWYASITENAKHRTLETYTETHHITPRSLGGSDDADNLVRLTAREHFVCHWLLIKMYTGEARYKMINALYLMKGQNKYQERYINSRVYETLRSEFSQYISELNTGRIQPQHEKDKQISSMTGRKRAPFSDEWIENIKKARQGEKNGMYGKKHSEDAKEKQRIKATSRKQSQETIQKKADAIRGSKREKKQCPHCDQFVAVNGYARWHGDNCKQAK